MVILHPSSRRKEARWESGHGLCPSEPDKWRSVVMVTTAIPLLEGRMEGSHALCTSDPEQWRSVAMTTPMCLPEGRREVGDGLCSSLPGRGEGVLGGWRSVP